ncbi:hypothetical protein H2204_005800 [Knufia peltigerae]|uniref:Amino acid transporter n=1 Tax=Knufia peltigerae TaxID=1002370 RepID=A0AA38Y5D1_9EURO|nr:hypothetical protein H2204_005800 [Knufia peltigerae]
MSKQDIMTWTENDTQPSGDGEIMGEVQPKVHFNLWHSLAMNFSITCTPLAIGAYLSLVIGLGGSPYYIWAFLFGSFFQLILGLAVAEIASSIPHSSGPAYWVQHLAPTKCAKFFGFLVGWTTTATWWFIAIASDLYLAQLTLGLAMALNPGYMPPQWQYYLVYCAWAVAGFVINLPYIFHALGPTLIAAFGVINVTAIFILVSLLVRATPKPPAHEVFVDVVNESGWSSNGVVFFLALLPSVLCVSGFDAITHITDELDRPTKQVPQVIIGSSVISAITGFVMTIVYSFCITKPENLLAPVGHQPIIQLLFDSCRSNALATIGTIGVILSFYIANVSTFTSWSRLYWSLSRENQFPFSNWTSKLSATDSLPCNAMVVNLFLVLALGAIQLGSLTALNAILGGAVVLGTVSYSLTFGCALYRGRDYLPSQRWLNLRGFGTPIIYVALIWCLFISVWLCFPLYLPVKPAYMNWASVVVVGVLLAATIDWFVRPSAKSRGATEVS